MAVCGVWTAQDQPGATPVPSPPAADAQESIHSELTPTLATACSLLPICSEREVGQLEPLA